MYWRLRLDVERLGGRPPASGKPARTLGCGPPGCSSSARGAWCRRFSFSKQVELLPLVAAGNDSLRMFSISSSILLSSACRYMFPDKCRAGTPTASWRRRRPASRGHMAMKPGQVLVLGSHAVREPGPHAGPGQPLVAAVHQPHRLLVVGRVGVHRPDDADVVDVRGGSSENLADLDAALTILLEPKRRRQRRAGLPLGRSDSPAAASCHRTS